MRFLPEVRPGERTRYLYASLAFVCVAAGGLVGRTVGDTLFLTRFGSGRLPLMYVSTAVLIALITLVYSAGFGQWRFSAVAAAWSAAVALAAVFIRLFLMGGSGTSRVVAYLFAEVVTRLPLLLFWTVAALAFDAREAKRLLGPIGAAGTAGCIVTGAAIPAFVGRFGTANLLWIVALLMAAFGVLATKMSGAAAVRGMTRRGGRSLLSYYRSLLGQRQIGGLALLVTIATLALILTDFIFKTNARAQLAGSDLAAFFGRFYAIANGGALLLQLVFVHRILARGVRFSLRLLPSVLLATSAGMALFDTFGWAAAAKLAEPLLEFTVNAAAIQMLYVAIQRQARGQTRALIDGIVKPAAFAAAGLLLVIIAPAAASRYIAGGVALLAMAWLFAAGWNARLYTSGLLELIGMRRFDVAQERVEFSDPSIAEHLRALLRSSSDDDVLYLLALLPYWKGIDWIPEYRLLLERPSGEVKRLCLERLGDGGDASDVRLVKGELENSQPAVRSAAVRAMVKLAGIRGAAWLIPILRDDPDANVRAAAAAELINCGELEQLTLGATEFRSMVSSARRTERLAAARSLLLIDRHALTGVLQRLLADSDPEVRVMALEAAASQRAPTLLPLVAGLLRDRRVAWKAAQVLPAFGDAALIAIGDALQQAQLDSPPPCALLVVPLLEQIGPNALPAVVPLLDAATLTVRHRAVITYCNLVKRNGSRLETRRIERLIERETDAASRTAAALREVAPGSENELLSMALSDEYDEHVDSLLRLLQVLHAEVEPALLARNLSEGGERRAGALEILDNVLASRFKVGVIAALESPSGVPGGDATLPALLGTGWSEWVTVGAIHAAVLWRRTDLRRVVEPYVHHGNAVIRETAEHALPRLRGRPAGTAVVEDELSLLERTSA